MTVRYQDGSDQRNLIDLQIKEAEQTLGEIVVSLLCHGVTVSNKNILQSLINTLDVEPDEKKKARLRVALRIVTTERVYWTD
ncbi:biofilm development regulator YmgB/AriR family protein [Enterobacillus tribolii]|uniref:Biofilm development protein YmgB/AriR n=1 Tax=Enterobacillus tribolii TaxID=1487935 RepID=A0A370R4J0_9GAMM|nr:biofilm development regulator YmgB/AriR family protein [Enterobacillus tribolii]MBW7984074.1 hypothetical protein [Enterobacillus tribolii]RDK97015.1 biofilm development protein YmgB/AriR [Enterobacillus tribolii]